MNLKYIIPLFISALVLYSCGDKETVDYNLDQSDDAQLYSFSMTGTHKKTGDSLSRAEDSLRFLVLNKTNFAINQEISFVYNPDSLPNGLKFAKVKLAVSYNTTYGLQKIEIVSPDSTYEWNTTDSVDFSKMPVKLRLTAPSGKEKEYDINTLIHRVNPAIFTWRNVGIIPYDVERQKVLMVGGYFYSYTTVSNTVKLYKSQVGGSSLYWSDLVLSNMPSNIVLNSITHLNGIFAAVTEDGLSYTSQDGQNWNLQSNGKNVVAVYGVLQGSTQVDDLFLVLHKDGSSYRFATTANFSSLTDQNIKGGFIEGTLPTTEFASTTNAYRNSNVKNILAITGGNASNGSVLNGTLLFSAATQDTINVSQSLRNPLFSGEGLSMFYYTKNSLYTIASGVFYSSVSWGALWNTLPKETFANGMPKRLYQSVVVDTDGYLWVFGGKSIVSGVYLNDVWHGRLNGYQ